MESAKKENNKQATEKVDEKADTKETADNSNKKTNKKTADKAVETTDKQNTVEAKTDNDQPTRYENPARSDEMESKDVIAKNADGSFDYSDSKTYVTKMGDTLFGIAQDNQVAMQQLRYFNGLPRTAEKLPVGIEIHIPSKFVDVPVGE